jgi:glycosyltransferase involved in cell wall biosynthesis
VERKGFHRVIEILPGLLKSHPGVHYLVVGGGSPEGNWRTELEQRSRELRLDKQVHFLGAMPSNELKWPLSASDVFVLATSSEGWANVFLEAMACGLPVITTDVGGNSEVVSRPELGTVVPFDNPEALCEALRGALEQDWDREMIRTYARENAWDTRVTSLKEEFSQIVAADSRVAGKDMPAAMEVRRK